MLKNARAYIKRTVLVITNRALDAVYERAKKAVYVPTENSQPLFLHEVESYYMANWDPDRKIRFVVSLIVGYDPDMDSVATPLEAAAAALSLTRDENSDGTIWSVYDRDTKKMHHLLQEDFEHEMRDTEEEVAKVPASMLRDLAMEVIETARTFWGETSEAFIDRGLDPEQVEGWPPSRRALLHLYRSARAVLAGLSIDDAFEDELAQIAELRDQDEASSRRIADLDAAMEKLARDQEN